MCFLTSNKLLIRFLKQAESRPSDQERAVYQCTTLGSSLQTAHSACDFVVARNEHTCSTTVHDWDGKGKHGCSVLGDAERCFVVEETIKEQNERFRRKGTKGSKKTEGITDTEGRKEAEGNKETEGRNETEGGIETDGRKETEGIKETEGSKETEGRKETNGRKETKGKRQKEGKRHI